MLMHEFGHRLQEIYGGKTWYELYVVPTSLYNFFKLGNENYIKTWTEIQANTMAYYFFNEPIGWNFKYYPIDNNSISDELKEILYFNVPK